MTDYQGGSSQQNISGTDFLTENYQISDLFTWEDISFLSELWAVIISNIEVKFVNVIYQLFILWMSSYLFYNKDSDLDLTFVKTQSSNSITLRIISAFHGKWYLKERIDWLEGAWAAQTTPTSHFPHLLQAFKARHLRLLTFEITKNDLHWGFSMLTVSTESRSLQ